MGRLAALVLVGTVLAGLAAIAVAIAVFVLRDVAPAGAPHGAPVPEPGASEPAYSEAG